MFDTVSQLEIFPTDLQMRRVDAARNMRRFYRMSIQPDLFGGASLVREWGRIGYRGQMMIEPHADEGQAVTALMKLARVKQRRGYA
ncbi:WGR domain-containing protein [Roseinatronobacter monicus]|uniref:Putative DNA-binding WGR domain protein n=1 Tax=Roseinatronobacter monicus TaxID=393481 RepID=A0A543K4U0_9RHOB|nr:WGR domain-containing protein [Roseinatronobacter monicus]TQM90054.1 putative DNA-binding WGR domain protein [Roseinatronobacter monicus]